MSAGPSFLREPRPAAQASVAATPALAPARGRANRHVPGEVGLWVFILGDMLMFGVFFAAFLVARIDEPEVFAAGRTHLSPTIGAVNTLVLLTSSLLVAVAVRAHRVGRREAARNLVLGAGACALVFAVLKVLEWRARIAAGQTPGHDDFFLYYFVVTGVHFAHLLIGAGVLTYLWRLLDRAPRPERDEGAVVESCASYWHMVDLLWIVIFPVLYFAST